VQQPQLPDTQSDPDSISDKQGPRAPCSSIAHGPLTLRQGSEKLPFSLAHFIAEIKRLVAMAATVVSLSHCFN
jgi:hypothetical protein